MYEKKKYVGRERIVRFESANILKPNFFSLVVFDEISRSLTFLFSNEITHFHERSDVTNEKVKLTTTKTNKILKQKSCFCIDKRTVPYTNIYLTFSHVKNFNRSYCSIEVRRNYNSELGTFS